MTVSVSSAREINVIMNPAPSQQQVNVSATPSSITTQPMDTTSAVHGGVVTARDLETIPLAERSFANIAYLVPGTEPVEPSDPTKARITAVSFGGSSGLNDVLSVDGGDNSDDYIGGFLQNFSPDAIQEFAVQTSQQNADIGRTVGGSVVITTKSGTNALARWSGFLRTRRRAQCALSDRESSAVAQAAILAAELHRHARRADRKGQALVFRFHRGSSRGRQHRLQSGQPDAVQRAGFSGLPGADPGRQFDPGAQQCLHPVPRLFGHACASIGRNRRTRSGSCADQRRHYVTDNALVQQATLPSTGATSHSNYLNVVLGQQYIFSPTWLGSFTLGMSYLHLTETRNSDLGFALAFPFSSTSQTISGFETFGDNQFVTPITAFPDPAQPGKISGPL